MKKLFALLLALCLLFSLAACKKPADTTGDTGTGNVANNNEEDTEWTYIHVENTGNFQKEELVTGTGLNAVSTEILNNDDLINPDKFAGKKIQIYGYDSDIYEDIDNADRLTFIWMVRAAVDEWAALNKVEVEYVGGYDQSVILSDINAGGRPDLLLYCNQFPLPALSGITRAFTQEEYDELAKTTGKYYLDMLNYKGESYGVQCPWSGGTLCYYNETQYEKFGVKSPGDYFMEDNWNWDTYEKAITEITKDIDGDGVIDLYGSGTTFWLIPHIYVRELGEDGKLRSLISDSEEYLRFCEIYYKSSQETKSTGKYNTCYIATSPRPATSFGDAEWYNYQHLYRELANGDIIKVVPLPKFTNDSDGYYGHTTVYSSIMTSCDEPEATLSLINYTMRVGMRYISDYSLGLYKCNYEGIRGASKFAHDWKERFAEEVADRKAGFEEATEWDQELYEKMQDFVLNCEQHFCGRSYPDSDDNNGGGVYNNETSKLPPESAIPIVAAREEAWMQVYNEKYAK